MQELIIALQSANNLRAEKRTAMLKIDYYGKLFRFLESRFEDGATYQVKNYFEDYKLETTDQKGEKKIVYGLVATNDRTYLGLNDLGFSKRLYKRTISKVDGVETTEYAQLPEKVQQGDLAVLFNAFKNAYKDALLAFDLLYLAIAKHNESRFVSEVFIYPPETFQRFKGEYVTSNFYLFNLKIGGTDQKELDKIVADICAIYENSLQEKAE